MNKPEPTTTIEQFAIEQCDHDSAMADACLETEEDAAQYPDWQHSSKERRNHFRTKARAKLKERQP